MTNTDKHKGHKGRYFNGKLVDNYLNMQLEIKRLRDGIEDIITNMPTRSVHSRFWRKQLKELIEGDE
jgi:hypothetical protein